MVVGLLVLRFQPFDLGIGNNGIRFPAGDISRRGVEIGLSLGHPGSSRCGAVLQAMDLFTGESQVGPGAFQRNLVRPRVDHEEEVARLNLLVVMHKYFGDVAVHLRRDTDEVGANRSIIRLRPYLPLEQSYHYRDGCGPDDGDAKYSAYDAAGTGIGWKIIFRHS